jgi:hypothetical protein
MTEPRILIHFEGKKTVYEPGEVLAGQVRIEPAPSQDIKAIELSILWYTDGKGDQDLHVRYFRRWSQDGDLPLELGEPLRFQTVLPQTPLSYDGLIIRIRWCVRVRIFRSRGRELVEEVPFRLGRVAPARVRLQ